MSLPSENIVSPEIGYKPTIPFHTKKKQSSSVDKRTVNEIKKTPSTPQGRVVDTAKNLAEAAIPKKHSPIEKKEIESKTIHESKKTPIEQQVEQVRTSTLPSIHKQEGIEKSPSHLHQSVDLKSNSVSKTSIPSPNSIEITEIQKKVENGLISHVYGNLPIQGRPKGPFTIERRMKELNVPGVSIFIINNGRLEWSKGYGELQESSPSQPKILSQIASISKIITSLTVLSIIEQSNRNSKLPSELVGDMKIELNTDIKDILPPSLWEKIDTNLASGAEHKITIERLLTHTSGIMAGGNYYYNVEAIDQDIAQVQKEIQNLEQQSSTQLTQKENPALKLAQERLKTLKEMRVEATKNPIPSIDDILEGKDQQLGEICVQSPPGDAYKYSNPGFAILQKVVEITTGKLFAEAVQERVLTPLRMENSMYSPPIARTVHGNDSAGNSLPGLWQKAPNLAAAGLWSTSEDLGKVVRGLQEAFAGVDTRIIGSDLASKMLEGTTARADYGLGIAFEKAGESTYFYHTGETPGFATFLIGNQKGQGAVILTNSDNGEALYLEIVKSIAEAYNWPDRNALEICQPEVKPHEISPIVLADWAEKMKGTYQCQTVGDVSMEHNVEIHFDDKTKSVLAEFDGGKTKKGGRTLTFIPLGDMVAYCLPDEQVCRFSEDKNGKMSFEIFGAKHTRIN